jgi:hypothetical protein
MIPTSHVGADNYAMLGNRLSGETHASRMARVNGANQSAPGLVGDLTPPVHIPATQGLAPLGGVGSSMLGGFDAMVYGAVTGLVVGVVAGKTGLAKNTKKGRRNTALAGGALGTIIGAAAHRGTPFGEQSVAENPIIGITGGLLVGGALTAALYLAGGSQKFNWKRAAEVRGTFWPLALVPAAVIGATVWGVPANRIYGALVGGALALLGVGIGHSFSKTVFN